MAVEYYGVTADGSLVLVLVWVVTKCFVKCPVERDAVGVVASVAEVAEFVNAHAVGEVEIASAEEQE